MPIRKPTAMRHIHEVTLPRRRPAPLLAGQLESRRPRRRWVKKTCADDREETDQVRHFTPVIARGAAAIPPPTMYGGG